MIWKSPIYLGGEVRRYKVAAMPEEWWAKQPLMNVLILPTHPDMERSAADELGSYTHIAEFLIECIYGGNVQSPCFCLKAQRCFARAGGADVDGDQVTVCWDSTIVEHVKEMPAVEMQSKAWYENANSERDDDLNVHPGSALSDEHAGSQQAGPLMAEDEDNGREMTKITKAKREFAVHCFIAEEGLGKKAMRQQRWKDLALSLKSTGAYSGERTHVIQNLHCAS